jgi:hypothetical protein
MSQTEAKLGERRRIERLIVTLGETGAKKKCVEYAHIYFEFLQGLHGGKMQMYHNQMRESVDEFLEFSERGS